MVCSHGRWKEYWVVSQLEQTRKRESLAHTHARTHIYICVCVCVKGDRKERERSRFILSDWSDFYMIDHLSIAFLIFTRCMLTSISVDGMLLPRYIKWSTNFRGLALSGDGSFLFKTFVLCFICILVCFLLLDLVWWRESFQAVAVSILLYGCTTWTLIKHVEKNLDGNCTKMMRAVLNKFCKQHSITTVVRPPTSHLTNCSNKMNKTFRALLGNP